MKKLKITFDSPAILIFTAICFGAFLLNAVTMGWTNHALFSVYRSSLLDPLTYVRMIGHVFGHADWGHFCGNIMLLLVVGPLLEEKYGTQNILLVMLVTALLTGLVHYLFFPTTALLGASGVVFAMILLSGAVNLTEKEVPVTLILVALFYLGGQVYDGLFVNDNVSNLTHILGGLTGAGMGFWMNSRKMKRMAS